MRLDVKAVDKSFGEKRVLEAVSFGVESGQALGLLGRNGAGKTTIIRIIMGVFAADSGSILLDGQPLDRQRVKIGYLPEERGLYPKKTISQQLQYLGALRGMSAHAAKKSIGALLERLNMSEYAGKRLEVLSKGNQQKIQLAAALLTDPDILILDEPFSGLDPVNAMLLREVVMEMIAKGKIVLFSSHQMNYTEEFCRDIVILNGGHIVLDGAIRDIKRGYARHTIVLTAPDAEKVERFVLEQASDISVKAERQLERVTVTLTEPEQKTELLRRLSAQNLDLDEFAVFEPSLNDIFVQYTEVGL